MTSPILEFKDEYRFLSNFFGASFVWDGLYWHHTEGAYQAAKTLDRDTRKLFSQMRSPATAKREGKTVKLRDDWEAVKYELMLEIVLTKFVQNPDLARQLIATGDAHLEEGNNHGDNIWGVCPPGSNNGLNYLGKVLMEVRTQLAR